MRHWQARIERVEADARDAKTSLQEWAQARGFAPPDYVELDRTGPDHAPVFTIEVRLANGKMAQGNAASKRAAEQLAAKALCLCSAVLHCGGLYCGTVIVTVVAA